MSELDPALEKTLDAAQADGSMFIIESSRPVRKPWYRQSLVPTGLNEGFMTTVCGLCGCLVVDTPTHDTNCAGLP